MLSYFLTIDHTQTNTHILNKGYTNKKYHDTKHSIIGFNGYPTKKITGKKPHNKNHLDTCCHFSKNCWLHIQITAHAINKTGPYNLYHFFTHHKQHKPLGYYK